MIRDERAKDIERVRKIRDGDEHAFTELYRRYRPNIYGYIIQRIEDQQDAEELVQDTFMKVWEHIHTLNESDKVLNWMYRIAAQLIAGWHRKHRSAKHIEPTVDVYEVEGETAASTVLYQTAEETAFIAERSDALYEVIAELSEREQRMIKLQLDGRSYKEIAEICEVTVSVVKNALSRAKQKLKVWADAWKEANAEGLDVKFSEVHEKKDK